MLTQTPSEPISGFATTGLSPAILTALSRLNFTTPTPIQAQAIPVVLTGSDVIGIAQTGTGKTMAFGLPMLEKLLGNPGRGLILVPTRELATQVEENLRRITGHLNPSIRTISLIGGMPIYRQIRDLRSNPRIIIATPGRLQDHLNQKTLHLNDVTTLVLDEADRMLDMGFAPQIKQIMVSIPKKPQTLLFSATFAPEIAALSRAYLEDPMRIEVAQAGTSASQVTQEIIYLGHSEKVAHLKQVLGQAEGPVLVFVRTKHGATKLTHLLRDNEVPAAEIHSNRSVSQRKYALDGFKNGKFKVLVATDVASRGIDVKNIELVVNYDLPDAAEDYIHRIGRTGRAGKSGKAVSFATHDQRRAIQVIERLMKRQIPLSPLSSSRPTSTFERSTERPQRQGGFSSPRRSGGNSGGWSKSDRPNRNTGGWSKPERSGSTDGTGGWSNPEQTRERSFSGRSRRPQRAPMHHKSFNDSFSKSR